MRGRAKRGLSEGRGDNPGDTRPLRLVRLRPRRARGVGILHACGLGALVESSSNVRRVVGLAAHGLGRVTRIEELPGFVEYRHVSQEEGV